LVDANGWISFSIQYGNHVGKNHYINMIILIWI